MNAIKRNRKLRRYARLARHLRIDRERLAKELSHISAERPASGWWEREKLRHRIRTIDEQLSYVRRIAAALEEERPAEYFDQAVENETEVRL